MKLAICGPGRCGKDEAALWLSRNTALRYWGSTSEVIAPLAAARLGISTEHAMARRHLDREMWAAEGGRMCADDPAALARYVLERGDIAVGLRRREEMAAVLAEGLVDLTIWIERPGIGPDPSLTYDAGLCDITVRNDGNLRSYHARLRRLARALGIMRDGARPR